MYRTVLVIGADHLSRFTDYTDRTSCILFGDGAGAVVLKAAPKTETSGILACELGADGSGYELMTVPAGGSEKGTSAETLAARQHYMTIRGKEVFKFAAVKMQELVQRAVASCGLTIDDVKLVVPHQVNTRILDFAAEKLNLPEGQDVRQHRPDGQHVGREHPDGARRGPAQGTHPEGRRRRVRGVRRRTHLGEHGREVVEGLSRRWDCPVMLFRRMRSGVMEKVAFLFPGQGAQVVGMCKDLYEAYPRARDVFQRGSDQVDFDLARAVLLGPDEKLQHDAVLAAVHPRREHRAARGRAQRDEAPVGQAGRRGGTEPRRIHGARLRGGAAVRGRGAGWSTAAARPWPPRARSRRARCSPSSGSPTRRSTRSWRRRPRRASIAAANYNSPEQVVLSGEPAALAEADRLAKEAGARLTVAAQGERGVSQSAHEARGRRADRGAGRGRDLEAADARRQQRDGRLPRLTRPRSASCSSGSSPRRCGGASRCRGSSRDGVTAFYEIGPGPRARRPHEAHRPQGRR